MSLTISMFNNINYKKTQSILINLYEQRERKLFRLITNLFVVYRFEKRINIQLKMHFV